MFKLFFTQNLFSFPKFGKGYLVVALLIDQIGLLKQKFPEKGDIYLLTYFICCRGPS